MAFGNEASRFGAPGRKPGGRPKGARNRLTVQVVEEQLRFIATFDPVRVFQGRNDGGTRNFRVRDLEAMPPEVRACISSMKIRLEKGEKLPDGTRLTEEVLEIKFWDKVKALELCAKHFGWVTTKPTVLVGKELRELLDEGRARVAALRQQGQLPPALPDIDVTCRPADSLVPQNATVEVDVPRGTEVAEKMPNDVKRHQSTQVALHQPLAAEISAEFAENMPDDEAEIVL